MTAALRSLFKLDYGGKIEREVAKLISAFDELKFDTGRYPRRWLALKLLEADADIVARVRAMPDGQKLIDLAQAPGPIDTTSIPALIAMTVAS